MVSPNHKLRIFALGVTLIDFLLQSTYAQTSNSLPKENDHAQFRKERAAELEPIQKFLKEPRILESLQAPMLKKVRDYEAWVNRNNPVYHYFKGKEQREDEVKKLFVHYPFQMKSAQEFADSSELDSLTIKKEEPYLIRKQKDLPIYYIGFSDDYVQGLAFDRLSVFAEVEIGKIVSEAELFGIFDPLDEAGGGGHDYRLSDISRFFNSAEKAGMALNPVERRLQDELISAGLIKRDAEAFVATKNVALISTVPVSSRLDSMDDLGRMLSKDTLQSMHHSCNAHEFNHGIYFTDRRYREAANRLWESLSTQEKKTVRDLLSFTALYDFDRDEDLLIREFIAFFRDPEELVRSYIHPLGEEVKMAKEGDHIFNLQPYFNGKTKLTPAALQQIKDLGKKVKSIDSQSSVYSPAVETESKGIDPIVLHLLPLVDPIFHNGSPNTNLRFCN